MGSEKPIYPEYDIEAIIANHLITVEEKTPKLKEIYGDDFNSFFYRPGVDKFIKLEVLPFLALPEQYNGFLDHDHWLKKHPFNFPGPFYTGESDTCGTGEAQAPGNVMYDSYYCEYIFKQPKSFAELLCVFDAAAVEVFDSYSCNGNNYWTYDKCKEWWSNKSSLIARLNDPEVKRVNGKRIQLYINYLNSEAESDLKRYCFFLENSYYPENANLALPDL